jgi:beta-fructofuranosidase
MSIFRRLQKGCASGDAIPFYHDGTYHLFFLTSPMNTKRWPERVRTTWQHATSKDLIHWEELPPALEPGNKGQIDADGCWTGSAIHASGKYHIFYTGYQIDAHNPQTICHASSDDGIDFAKDSASPYIKPDEELYEPIDWRDPYIFYNEDAECYWMIIAARKKEGPDNRRGCVVLYTTSDLKHFEHQGTIYEPYHTNCPECPEMYKFGDFWYLSYSRFSERAQTLYRFSKSPYGPWRTPKYDGINCRRFYAAKSLVNNDKRRFYFGWIHEREDSSDTGWWQWGGDFAIPNEVIPTQTGDLKVCMPKEFKNLFNKEIPIKFKSRWGTIKQFGNKALAVNSIGTMSFGYFEVPKQQFLFECDIRVSDCSDNFGLTLYTDDDLDKGYQVAFNRQTQSVILNKLPAPLDPFWATLSGKELQSSEVDGPRVCEKPLEFKNGDFLNIKVFLDKGIMEMFIDNRVAFCYRTYTVLAQKIGVFVQDGNIEYHNITIKTE